VRSAAELTKDLLGFAKGGKYEVKTTDLNALIRNETRMFGQTKKEIRIREKLAGDLWTVEVDQGQIRQALLNLFVNAWQAMPGGGDLYVQTGNVTLDQEDVNSPEIAPGRFVRILVTDTGVGMDARTVKKIFDPFFSTRAMGKGTGLGLASVYGIVKNHGGFINVQSEKGKGATFTLYLPASDREVVEEEKPDAQVVMGEGGLLLVDDEQMILEVGGQLLERLGYRVFTAGSGPEALELYAARKGEIDLVVLDMIMPGMSGGETYDRMREIDPEVRVLLSSGYTLDGQAQEILDRGCQGFIQKPFDLKALSRKIRQALDI
jgi:CheY-like chemotaxis protein